MHSWEQQEQQIPIRGKKYNKKLSNVPIHELGFRERVGPDIIDPRNIKKIRRTKKKKYVPKSSKQIFLSRLRLVIDVDDLPDNIMSHQFQVNKICHWNYVKKVFSRTQHKIYCYICLQQDIIAPQITFCGHIFCFHCILMHFKKSQNRSECPVCKQFTQVSELKTCQPIYEQQLKVNDEIQFSLKYKIGPIIYNSQTLAEDIDFNQIVRKRKDHIVKIFNDQQNQIMQQLAKTPQTQRNHHYLTDALSIARSRLEKSKAVMQKAGKVKLRPNQKIIDNTVISFCEYESIKPQNKYYQAKNGRKVYLHNLCRKYLEKDTQNMPNEITSRILLTQQEQFDPEIALEYKQLNHLLLGQDFQIVIIDMNEYLDIQTKKLFQRQFQKLQIKKKQFKQKQEAQAKIRSQIYEEQLKQRRMLQKMMHSQFHDISVPPLIDPSQINSEYDFPSLNTAPSQKIDQVPQPYAKKTTSHQQNIKEEKKTFTLADNIDDFPDLLIQLKPNKSEAQGKISNNKRKKKKQKKIDITAEIFKGRYEDYDEY